MGRQCQGQRTKFNEDRRVGLESHNQYSIQTEQPSDGSITVIAANVAESALLDNKNPRENALFCSIKWNPTIPIKPVQKLALAPFLVNLGEVEFLKTNDGYGCNFFLPLTRCRVPWTRQSQGHTHTRSGLLSSIKSSVSSVVAMGYWTRQNKNQLIR